MTGISNLVAGVAGGIYGSVIAYTVLPKQPFGPKKIASQVATVSLSILNYYSAGVIANLIIPSGNNYFIVKMCGKVFSQLVIGQIGTHYIVESVKAFASRNRDFT